ncbi:MAG TPA: 2Fe-2S iron-sulfur cluster-binding protein [Candidatus Sulfotelmatobacter sp.]|nr:2Fe-2S iron-sulfur cluster-binding protein [Candidatus Sulfotelmatobacter sp.]
MTAAAASYRVTIANVGRSIDCAADQTVLQAAVAAGIDYPYACASGNCGTCVSHLDAGEVGLLPRNDAALTQQQVQTGHTLACRARPLSDLTVTWLARRRQ